MALALAALIGACNDPTGPDDLVRLDFCSDATPVWFGFRDEGGTWTRVTGDDKGTFTFTPQGKVLLTYVLLQPPYTFAFDRYVTADELREASGATCRERRGPELLYGTLTGIGAGNIAVVSVGNAGGSWMRQGDGSFNTGSIPDGPIDVVVVRAPDASAAGCAEVIPDRVIVQRDLNFNNTLPPLSFDTHGESPQSHQVSFSGLAASDVLGYSARLVTRTTNAMLTMACRSGPVTSAFRTLAAASMRTDDYYTLAAQIPQFAATRSSRMHFATPGNKDLAFGPPASAATRSLISSTPMVRYQVSIARQPEYPDYVWANLGQEAGSANPRRFASILMSAAYANEGGSWELAIPDMTQAPGWSDWGLFPERVPSCNVSVHRGRWVLGFDVRPTENEVERSATASCAS